MTVKFDFGALDQPFEADWPVTVLVPQDGGTVEEQVFMARFRLQSREELSNLDAAGGTDDFMKTFFVGLGEGESQTLTDELRAKMIGRPFVRAAILRAFRDFQVGVAAKN